MRIIAGFVLVLVLSGFVWADGPKQEPAPVIVLVEQEQTNLESLSKELEVATARKTAAQSDLDKVNNTEFVEEAQLKVRIRNLELELLRALVDNYKLRLYAKYKVSEADYSLQLEDKKFVLKKNKSE